MLTRFIGDVHGKYKQYKRLLKDCPRSIQVGDMGVGFLNNYGEEYGNPPHYAMSKGDHRFIRGNHDNPSACARHDFWIKDGLVEDNMMFVGGALSVDKDRRTLGYDWWDDEELSHPELDALVQKFIDVKPEIMVTHDCPEDIAKILVSKLTGTWEERLRFQSKTQQAFQEMFSAHSPKLWVFGHWHVSLNIEVNETQFVCLAELQAKDIDV